VLVFAGLDRMMPTGLEAGHELAQMSLVAAVVVLLAWTVIPMLAGAWRTMTRDA
jgi:hypothetical protein